MSDTADPPVELAALTAAEPAVSAELPVAYSVYAATLRPKATPVLRNGRPVVLNGRRVQRFTAGHPDQIWLKLLKIRHGARRMTPTQWKAAIDAMQNEPVHPMDPRTR